MSFRVHSGRYNDNAKEERLHQAHKLIVEFQKLIKAVGNGKQFAHDLNSCIDFDEWHQDWQDHPWEEEYD
tara:strand:+ start:153 stop:362 length:210 start_codon:yes stop_codon:yes gene_type:complete